MGRRRSNSRSTVLLVVVLLMIGIGIAYAVLTEQLTINNTVSYDAMKWDVGVTAATDGWESYIDTYIKMYETEVGTTLEEQGTSRDEFEQELKTNMEESGTIYTSSTATISPDKKVVEMNCDLVMSSKSQFCIIKATIVNDSTFNIAFSESPVFTYESDYIVNYAMAWVDHDFYGVFSQVSKGQTLAAGETADVFIAIMTTQLTEETLPQITTSVQISVELKFEESDYLVKDLSMLTSRSSGDMFWSDTYRTNIKNITFENQINIPSDAIESWDISLQKDSRIMSYIVLNASDSTYYDLYIQSDEQLYANFDMSRWFAEFEYVDSINGLKLLDTRYTSDMSYMFEYTGYDSLGFNLDVSNFDTSNVTNMSYMFHNTGYKSSKFTLDVSNFDTSEVTNMREMFWNTGYNNPTFMLDVSNFDTSNVTDMSWMFECTGFNSVEFDLDVSNFDTSKVLDMYGMFYYTGYNSSKFVTSITIRNPNVEDFDIMFNGAAVTSGSQITVNYTSETSDLVDRMIATKSDNSNVVKGVQVD